MLVLCAAAQSSAARSPDRAAGLDLSPAAFTRVPARDAGELAEAARDAHLEPVAPLVTNAPTFQPADSSSSKPVSAEPPPSRQRSYELPAIHVEGEPVSSLREEDRVGSYAQPRWTATRRFPSTRVYVIPEGKVEVEFWYRPTFKRDNTTETRMLAELEIGLPYRFQLDIYARTDQDDAGEELQWGEQFEVRWAWADWGKIWGNPTFYFEFINLEGRPNKIEPKLLLGGEIPQWGEGWHWGANFVAELEISGPELEHEYEFTSGLSKTVIDSVFSVGGEFKFSLVDVKENRGHYETPFYLGPTFQWRPIDRMTVNLETLVGLGGESPYGQITLNVGFEF